VWQRNTEEERLLGVSLTGISDNTRLSRGEWLDELKEVAVETNAEWADRLGISRSAAITCVKPSGTVSQLVNSASGIHPRHSNYYVRRVRNDVKDPVTEFLVASGVPHEIDARNAATMVFSFPQKAPDKAVCRADRGAVDCLEQWLVFQDHWCEHKPSVTISVKDNEWLKVGSWCYDNFDVLSGVSFLPYDPTVYPQAPYEEITKDEYEKMVAEMPKLDWSRLAEFEKEDNTVGSQELACVTGICEI
jgi:ribonucleoside-triphosphate reductase